MKEFDFMKARKELQQLLKEFYIVTYYFTDKKRLEIRGTAGILDTTCIEYIYKFCVQHDLKYYVHITYDNCPAFVLFQ